MLLVIEEDEEDHFHMRDGYVPSLARRPGSQAKLKLRQIRARRPGSQAKLQA